MTHAVQFTSLKGKTYGQTRTETYDTAADARFAASMMREGGHRDARAIELDPIMSDLRKVARAYEICKFSVITDQVIDDLVYLSDVARPRVLGFIRCGHINPAMRSAAEGGIGA